MQNTTPSKPVFDKYALMALTSTCNQKCFFCFEAGVRYEIPERQIVYKNIDDMILRGFSKIVFIGGEVTLVPDLPEIISYITAKGMKAHIATNGLRLADRGFLKTLLDSGLRHIEFSFHTHIPRDSLATTGRADSLSLQLAALENIAELAPLYEPALTFNTNTVVTSVNAPYLPELAAFILQYKHANALSFKYTTFEGRMIENLDAAARFPQLIPALEQIRSMTAAAGATLLLDGFPLCVLPQHLFASDVVFQDMDSMLFGFNYSRRVTNTRFDLLPPEKASPKCNTCVLSPVCAGMPGEYINKFTDGEISPFSSFLQLEERPRAGAISCLLHRHAKNNHNADPANIQQWDADGIEWWVRGTLAAADNDGAARVIFDLAPLNLRRNMISSFFKAFSRYRNNASPLVRCRPEMFSDPAVMHVFKPISQKIEIEALLYSSDEETHNALAGDALFKKDCMGIMALVECGAPPRLFVPASAQNAPSLTRLIHFAGLSGARGVTFSCEASARSCRPTECQMSKHIELAIKTAQREYPAIELIFSGASPECLPHRHLLYRPPFSEAQKEL